MVFSGFPRLVNFSHSWLLMSAHRQVRYEVAVKELVEAKVNNLPIPKDEVSEMSSGKVINLMDALRSTLQSGESRTAKSKKGAQEVAESGMELVKASTRGKRKSA